MRMLEFTYIVLAALGGAYPASTQDVALAASTCTIGPKQELIPVQGTAQEWGHAVAMSGPFAAIGAPTGTSAELGLVDIFRNENGTFTHFQTIFPTGGAPGEEFGISVAIDGNVLVIGARRDDEAGPERGSVSVFEFDGLTWSFLQKLTASDGSDGDWFGDAVAIEGNTIVVGALRANPNNINNAGEVYVFNRVGSLWLEQQRLTVSSPLVGPAAFGEAVALDGDLLLVGAHAIAEAIIFRFDGSQWVEEQTLTAFDGAEGEYGAAVAISGDRIVVASDEDNSASLNAGSVYIYRLVGGIWQHEQKLTPAPAFSFYGASVAISGNVLIVGATGGNAGMGGFYTHFLSPTGWTEGFRMFGATDSTFGFAVALEDDLAVIGAPASGALPGLAAVTRVSNAPLLLDTNQDGVAPAETLNWTTSCVNPGSLGLLYITSVNGTPFVRLIANELVDTSGQWSFNVTVPAGLPGLTLDFASISIDANFEVLTSNIVDVLFL